MRAKFNINVAKGAGTQPTSNMNVRDNFVTGHDVISDGDWTNNSAVFGKLEAELFDIVDDL